MTNEPWYAVIVELPAAATCYSSDKLNVAREWAGCVVCAETCFVCPKNLIRQASAITDSVVWDRQHIAKSFKLAHGTNETMTPEVHRL